MKRLILAAMTVAAMTVASTAQAALAYSFLICQGATCLPFATNVVVGTTVGDYTISLAGGSATQGTLVSDSSQIDLNVTRTGQTSAAPLSVWFTVTGYTSPTGPTYAFDVSLGAGEQSIDANSSRGLVTYQAWYSSTNSTTIPPTGSPTNLASCTPPPGAIGITDSCNSNPGPVLVAPGSNLFSIISLTQFFIGLGDTSQYGAVGQASLAAVVPEPGSMVLLGSGLLGMAAMLRRRHARK